MRSLRIDIGVADRTVVTDFIERGGKRPAARERIQDARIIPEAFSRLSLGTVKLRITIGASGLDRGARIKRAKGLNVGRIY
ncbi:MAG: hypothetical protein U0Y68_20750 [Blastocatellia bacterium]